jgi:hypothetical protein
MTILQMDSGSYVNVSKVYVVSDGTEGDYLHLYDEHGRLVKKFPRTSDMYFFASDNNIELTSVH